MQETTHASVLRNSKQHILKMRGNPSHLFYSFQWSPNMTDVNVKPSVRIGREATYPYFEKETSHGISFLNNFPRLPKYIQSSTSNFNNVQLQSPDLTKFWVDYFDNTNTNRPGYDLKYKDEPLLERVHKSLTMMTILTKYVFAFTIGGDKQASLQIGRFFPISADDGDLDRCPVFDFKIDINVRDFIPQEWIDYERARASHVRTWLDFWLYDSDFAYAVDNCAVVMTDGEDEVLTYDFLSKNIYLRVLLQRWLNTIVHIYLSVVLKQIMAVRKLEDTDSETLKNIETVVNMRSDLVKLISRMSNYWILKGDPKGSYGEYVDSISKLLDISILNSTR